MASRSERVFTWNIKNLEPTEDIKLSFAPIVFLSVNQSLVSEASYERRPDGITMAYLRPMLRGMRGIDLRSDGRTCRISYRHRSLKLTSGSKRAQLGIGKSIILPRAPILTKDGLVVPVAAVARALGGKVTHGNRDGGYGSGYYMDVQF